MKFRTLFSRKSFPCPSGSRYRKNYIKSYDGNKTELRENGVEDVYDSIQKAAQGITIEDLIRRARNGDTSAIGQPVDSYVDLTQCPKDLLEAHQMIKGMKDKYYELPVEVRNRYGNSFDAFLAAVNSGDIYNDLTQINAANKEVAEVKEKVLGGNENA